MKGPTLLLSLFFVLPASAQSLTSVQTDCTHVRSDSTRPEPPKLNETKIGKDMVCGPRGQNSTPMQPLLKLGDKPADHSVVPKIDSPPPLPVKTAFINSGG
jgi:hypothetical protein